MTDERVDEALRRAAELLHKLVPGRGAYEYLAGWAEAVKLLDCWHQELYEQENDGASLGYPGLMHEGMCNSTTQCDPCKPCRAKGSFCDTMLGGDGA